MYRNGFDCHRGHVFAFLSQLVLGKKHSVRRSSVYKHTKANLRNELISNTNKYYTLSVVNDDYPKQMQLQWYLPCEDICAIVVGNYDVDCYGR
jgi:hypothetical protein